MKENPKRLRQCIACGDGRPEDEFLKYRNACLQCRRTKRLEYRAKIGEEKIKANQRAAHKRFVDKRLGRKPADFVRATLISQLNLETE